MSPEYTPIKRNPSGNRALQCYSWVKKKVIKRDNYKCTTCGGKAQLVHHTVPVWQLERTHKAINDMTKLTSLCNDCHEAEHYDIQPRPSKQLGAGKK